MSWSIYFGMLRLFLFFDCLFGVWLIVLPSFDIVVCVLFTY